MTSHKKNKLGAGQLIEEIAALRAKHPALAADFDQLTKHVHDFTANQTDLEQRLAKIGAALGAERHIPTLLEMILLEAMRLNSCDGGTFYEVKHTESGEPISLGWVVMKNNTLNTWSGGTSGTPITLPDILLYRDGSENHANVSAHVALSGEIIQLDDVYDAAGFDFQGTRMFDSKTGYRSKSMLVIPLRNHENEIVAVMQLINAMPDGTTVVAFSNDNISTTVSLATQAAVAITNARLIDSLQALFDAFIKAIAQSIDAKDEVTGGHISRVSELTMRVAKAVNEADYGPYQAVNFDEDEMRELSIAAWLHDTGKITTPETVMFKATKLESYSDRIDNVKLRMELYRALQAVEVLQKKCQELSSGKLSDDPAEWDETLKSILEQTAEEWKLLEKYNVGAEFLRPEIAEQIKAIANRSFKVPEAIKLPRTIPYYGYLSRKTWEAQQPFTGPREEKQLPVEPDERPLLTADELLNMLIGRGTLNDEERIKMQDHVVQTMNILEQLPFTKKLKNVPVYAGGHHEFVNGKGYPKRLAGDQLPIQSRILALADIFEALSAADRPYKKAKPMSEVLKIMGFMVKGGEIDEHLFEIFIKSGVMAEYTREFVMENQIDIDVVSGHESK